MPLFGLPARALFLATLITPDLGAQAHMRLHRRSSIICPNVGLVAVLVITALLAKSTIALAQSVFGDLDMPDGPVYAAALAGNTIYLGGQFTRVGSVSEYGAVLSSSGRLVQALHFDLRPFTAAPDGAGGWFVGGEFASVNGVARDGLAHVLADGTLAPWAPRAGARVMSLAVSGSTVYVGGEFNDVNGESRNHLAAIDAVTGELMSWNPNAGNVTTSYISSIAVSSGTVYVAGMFPEIGSVARPNIAAIDSATGAPTSWNPQADHEVFTLAIRGTTIYAGGRFTAIGGQARRNIAALDVGTGQAIAWDPNADSDILAITPTADAIYVGGIFSDIGGRPRAGVAALDPMSGAATDWAPTLTGACASVWAMSVAGSTVYLGGCFDAIEGLRRHNLGAVDAITGQVAAWDPGADQRVFTLATQDSILFAGGEFRSVAGKIRHNLAAIDRTTHHVTDWDPNANGAVRALVWDGSTLYVGGSFDMIGGLKRHHLAALDLDAGAPSAWDPDADGGVRALALRTSTLYIGGSFKHVGGQARNRLAAIDVATALPDAWNPGADSTVRALAIGDSLLYVGGTFQQLAGQPRSCMGALDLVTGEAAAWRADVAGSNPDVYALVVNGPLVYAGGDFFQVAGQPHAYLVALNGASGVPMAFDPSFQSTAYAIALGSTPTDFGIVYVAGVNLLRAYDGAGHLTGWAPYFYGNGYALAAREGTVYVGGDFSQVGNFPRQGIAAIEGDHTTPTLLLRFDAEPTADGIVLHWQLVVPFAGESRLERADAPGGPWMPLEAETRAEGSGRAATDRTVRPGRSYWYRLIVEIDGETLSFGPIAASTTELSGSFALTQVAPVPTSGSTTIEFTVAREARIRLSILDVQGRLVARLVDAMRRPGRYQTIWSGTGKHSPVPSGAYFVLYEASGHRMVRRLVVSR